MSGAAAELHLDGSPSGAAEARAFAAAALRDVPEPLVDDARLVLTELVTNAVLHGSPPVVVRVRRQRGGVRLEVEDAGHKLVVRPVPSADAMTGRGLALVAAVTSGWGVEPGSAGGKVVWAQLSADHPQGVADQPDLDQPDVDLDALLASWSDDEAEPLLRVELGAVPTDLLLDAKRHIDNVVRELTFVRAGAARTGPLPPEVEALVHTVTDTFSRARAEIKRQAAEAAARGDADTHLVLTLPASSADAGEDYLAALDEVDRYARDARMLTLETPALHKVFRRWYVQALVDQLRARAGGVTARPARPFVQVLADEVADLSRLRVTAQRLQLLQRVNAELTSVSTPGEMAQVVVRHATASVGALAAHVFVADGARLRLLASSGRTGEAAPPGDLPADADLPVPVVHRTAETVVLPSMAEAARRFPGLPEPSAEQSMHVVPLTVGEHRIGVLSTSFAPVARLAAAEQTAFVRALADALAQALERHLAEQALRGERDVVRSLHRVGLAVTSHLERGDVVQTVTDAATQVTGAQFGAFFYNVIDDDGEGYSLYAISGVAREAFAHLPMPRKTAIFAPTFEGHGVVRIDDVTTDPRYGHSPPHHGLPQGHLPVRSHLAVPVVLSTGEVAGGLFFGHERAGVFDDVAEQLATGIAGYAAIALENGRLYEAARRESRIKERVAAALEWPLRPPPLPTVPGVELAGVIESFGGEGELGGDFYDAFALPGGRWLLALGDVSGKGPEAAAVTGLVRDTLWASAQHGGDAVAMLRVVNAALLRQDTDRFATLVAAVLTPSGHGVALDAVWAGHPPGLLLRSEAVEPVSGAGMPLGMFPDVGLETVSFRLTPGDMLLLSTDGLSERQGAVLSAALLARIVQAAASEDLSATLRAILRGVDALHRRRDDVALLGVRVPPAG